MSGARLVDPGFARRGPLARAAPRAVAALASARRAGVMDMAAALLAAQGASYVTQLVIARIAPPSEFAVVRSVEATLSVALVMASAGAPLLALRGAAVLVDPRLRARMLAALLRVVLGAGGVTALALGLAAPLFGPVVEWPMRLAAGLLLPAAFARTLLNYGQGVGEVRRVARWTAALAVAGAGAVVGGMAVGGVPGWLAGRYVGDLAMLACLGLALRWRVDWRGEPPAGYAWRPLLAAGSGIALSLLLRSAQDNMPLVALNVGGVAASDVGVFGLPHAMVMGFQIIPAALSSVMLPRLAAAVAVPGAARALVRRVGGWSTLAVAVLALAVAAVGPVVIRTIWTEYSGALPLLPVLLAAVPLRMLTSLSGIVLVAYGDVRATVAINAAAAAAAALALALLVPRYGIAGAAWAFLAAEGCGALAYGAAALARLRGRTSPATRPAARGQLSDSFPP